MNRRQNPHEPHHGTQSPEAPAQHGLEADDAWQGVIGRYLNRRCDMQAPEIFEVLCKCEHDEVTRARYLRMAREAMP